VYGVLTALNIFWFHKLMLLALSAGTKKSCSKLSPTLQPSPTAAAATDITATSGQAAGAEAGAESPVKRTPKTDPLVRKSQRLAADWLQKGKQKAAAASGFGPAVLADLQTRSSDCPDSPRSPRIGAAYAVSSSISSFGPAVLASWDDRCLPAAEVGSSRAAQSGFVGRKPPVSPFAALAHKSAVSAFGPAVLDEWQQRQSLSPQSHDASVSHAAAAVTAFGPAVLADWEQRTSS